MQTSQMPSQNKSMQEVLPKSDNGKRFKNRGQIRECNRLIWRTCTTAENSYVSDFVTFFKKMNFNMGFEISLVGIQYISTYMKSDQPRVAGKHSTRHAKKQLRCCGYISNLASRAYKFVVGLATAARIARKQVQLEKCIVS